MIETDRLLDINAIQISGTPRDGKGQGTAWMHSLLQLFSDESFKNYTLFPLAVANQNQSGSSTLNQTSNSLFLKKKKQQLCTQPLTLLSQSFIQQFRFHTPKLCQGEFTALPPKDLSSFNAWASSAKILKTRMLPNVRKNLAYSVLQLRSGTCVTSAPEKLF